MRNTKVSLMAGVPTNILDESGLRVARCDFDGDTGHPDAIANAQKFVTAWNDLDLVREKVRRIQAHVEAGGANEELTAATVLCSEILLAVGVVE